MKYPNLAAEIEATGWHITSFADAAGVTVEVMQDVLDGNEDLVCSEAVRLHRHLAGGRTRCSFDYLYAPAPAVLRPDTNKYKYRRRLLYNATQAALDTGENDTMYKRDIDNAIRVLARMTTNRPVHYADYRHSLDNMYHVISAHQHKTKLIRGKDGEMVSKQPAKPSPFAIHIHIGGNEKPFCKIVTLKESVAAMIYVPGFRQIPDMEDIEHELVTALREAKEAAPNA